jgi:hypothetical protein
MDLGISKRASRKAMRVATVFTGVTACAATFTPAANAQPAGNLAPPLALRPTVGLSIRSGATCSDTPHWFHLYSVVGKAFCIGGTGSKTGPGSGFGEEDGWARAFCGGNNVGYFSGSLLNFNTGSKRFVTNQRFHQSSTPYVWPKSYSFLLEFIKISAWTGNEVCPTKIPAPGF